MKLFQEVISLFIIHALLINIQEKIESMIGILGRLLVALTYFIGLTFSYRCKRYKNLFDKLSFQKLLWVV